MNFGINLPPLALDARRQFHVIFSNWLELSTEAEFEQLIQARHTHAPGQVCSMVNLVRQCLRNPVMRPDLPESLLQLLRQKHWLRPSAVATLDTPATARLH